MTLGLLIALTHALCQYACTQGSLAEAMMIAKFLQSLY